MSRYFKQEQNCRVIGVEIDKAATQKASRYCQQVIVGNLDSPETWRRIRRFRPYDVVFASAVIEHLKDPWQIIQLIKHVLKRDGTLIVTTSNIAFWRMRLKLFLGHWDYEDYGTLDNTHLRFFTYQTFQKLVADAGFIVDYVAIDPAGGIKYFNWLARFFPNLYAHQMVIQAHKP